MSKSHLSIVIAALAMAVCSCGAATAKPEYNLSVIDLPDRYPADWSFGGIGTVHINDLGQIAGTATSDLSSSSNRVFFWDATSGLAYLDEPSTSGRYRSYANGFNNQGEVVGYSSVTGTNHAMRWKLGAQTVDLGAIYGPSVFSIATAIDDDGNVVGFASGQSSSSVIVWDADNDHRVVSSGRSSDINDSGVILAGAYSNEPYLLEPDGDLRFLDINLDQFSTGYSFINNRNQVAGTIFVGTGMGHAYFWDELGGAIDIGSINGYFSLGVSAQDINDSGVVVGFAYTGVWLSGFVWTRDAGVRDLNVLVSASDLQDGDLHIMEAMGVNNRGQIVGRASRSSDGDIVLVVLSPVPETSSLALIAFGGLFLFGMLRRRAGVDQSKGMTLLDDRE